MIDADPTSALPTPLHALHLRRGARIVPFAGYALPLQYPTGVIAEHRHTRDAAGLFDVSHMGQIVVGGADAAAALESLMPVDVVGLAVGRQRYAVLTDDGGGIVDDLMLAHRPRADGSGSEYLLVVNAGCKHTDLDWMRSRIGARCLLEPQPEQALLALQGPLAQASLEQLLPGVGALHFMDAAWFELPPELGGAPLFVSRSGYTGEDGFELSVPAAAATALAEALLGLPGVAPVGLGARDTLRLEAGLCLYGQDIDTRTTPVEAGLQWAIPRVRRSGGARAGGFPGAARILDQLDAPALVRRLRVGLRALSRVPVRAGAPLLDARGDSVGRVTSGSPTPSVDTPIAIGYLDHGLAAPGTRVHAVVRGRPVEMEVCALPFVPHRYRRG